jgi:hypothetical protein
MWLMAWLVGIALIALAVCSDRGAADEPIIVPKDMRDAVNKMADDVGKGKNIEKEAAAFFNAHPGDLKTAMWVFKQRQANGEGGLGVGVKPEPTSTVPDGIEAWIVLYGNPKRKPLSEKELMKRGPDIQRLADVVFTMATTVQENPPDKQAGLNPPLLWAPWKNYGIRAAVSVMGTVGIIVDARTPHAIMDEFAIYQPLGPLGVIIAARMKWNQSKDEMKKGATDLRTAVKTGKPDDVKKAFCTIYNGCVRCHQTFRE